uniref:Ig-like domain-containing protein n=1 Tax=Scleropages formosus TaxID=113540 RepID=A0A8C9RIP1_SCLFO
CVAGLGFKPCPGCFAAHWSPIQLVFPHPSDLRPVLPGRLQLTLTLLREVVAAFANKESVQREVKAMLSQKATLSCEVSDAQTEVKWYKDSKLLSSSRKMHMEAKGKSRQLVLDSVEKTDAGEYICEAAREKLHFTIHVAGRMGFNGNIMKMRNPGFFVAQTPGISV